MRAARTVTLAFGLLAGCAGPSRVAAEGQVLLYVDTDAPVPSLSGAATAPPPLFDRLRLDVYAPGGATPCDGCTNDFALDFQTLQARRASLGIVPPLGVPGYVARVRMYNEALADSSGEPDPDSTVDFTVALPTVTGDAVFEGTVLLPTDQVGQPVGSLDGPVPTTAGPPTASLVGTWPGAQRVDCPSAPAAGMRSACRGARTGWAERTRRATRSTPRSPSRAWSSSRPSSSTRTR